MYLKSDPSTTPHRSNSCLDVSILLSESRNRILASCGKTYRHLGQISENSSRGFLYGSLLSSLSLSGPQGRDSLLWQHRNNIFQASLKTDFWVPHADFLAWWEGPDVKKKKKEFLGDSNVQVLLVHTLSWAHNKAETEIQQKRPSQEQSKGLDLQPGFPPVEWKPEAAEKEAEDEGKGIPDMGEGASATEDPRLGWRDFQGQPAFSENTPLCLESTCQARVLDSYQPSRQRGGFRLSVLRCGNEGRHCFWPKCRDTNRTTSVTPHSVIQRAKSQPTAAAHHCAPWGNSRGKNRMRHSLLWTN